MSVLTIHQWTAAINNNNKSGGRGHFPRTQMQYKQAEPPCSGLHAKISAKKGLPKWDAGWWRMGQMDGYRQDTSKSPYARITRRSTWGPAVSVLLLGCNCAPPVLPNLPTGTGISLGSGGTGRPRRSTGSSAIRFLFIQPGVHPIYSMRPTGQIYIYAKHAQQYPGQMSRPHNGHTHLPKTHQHGMHRARRPAGGRWSRSRCAGGTCMGAGECRSEDETERAAGGCRSDRVTLPS